jgi:murein DD-endopeptidase MepM/ murein hydrolase activator NlpD
MKSENLFLYDKNECRFVKADYPTHDRIVHYLCMWVLTGVVLAGVSIAGLSVIAGSPAELALKAENTELIRQLRVTDTRVQTMQNQVTKLSRNDAQLYRSMLGMEPISEDERMAGVGGADIFSGFDVFSESASSVLKSVNENLEVIEHRLRIQQRSFDEIIAAYSNFEERMAALPVIKPVQGSLISGFGYRNHPIYKMSRMHEGVDFKGDTGDPIYATGDGTIAFASRYSGFGNFIRLDHGDGIESAYAHLSKFAQGIVPGKKVKRGDLIGYVGSTGLSAGPHLHYEIRIDGVPIDPLNYLALDVSPEEYREFLRISENNPRSMD